MALAYSSKSLCVDMVPAMNELFAIVVSIVAVIMLYRYMRRGRADAIGEPETPHPFHAVGVKPGRPCCPDVVNLKGRRFLSREAPALPLMGCKLRCACVYRHFDDRRDHTDRRDPYGLRTSSWEQPDQPERRGRRGRRYTDRVGHGMA